MKISGPKLLLHLEGLAALLVACVLYHRFGGRWLWFGVFFLAPDLLMLGYAAGIAVGARIYNLGHTYAVPAALALAGYLLGMPELVLAALIWIAHIGADRLLGYGLKYPTAFKDTHLSRV